MYYQYHGGVEPLVVLPCQLASKAFRRRGPVSKPYQVVRKIRLDLDCRQAQHNEIVT